jgi:hypothetical protein
LRRRRRFAITGAIISGADGSVMIRKLLAAVRGTALVEQVSLLGRLAER